MAATGVPCLRRLSSVVSLLVYVAVSAVTILTYYFIPWRLLTATLSQVFMLGSFILVLAVLLAILIDRAEAGVRVEEAVARACGQGGVSCLFATIAVGIALRLLWVTFVQPVQFSDFATYWDLAVQLVETGRYVEILDGHELRAHRPIGLPLVLAGGIWVLGPSPAVPTAVNLLAFVLSALFIYDIARQIGSNTSGLLGAILFALYPANIAMTGLAATEPLSLCLYLGVGWALLASAEGRAVHPWLAGVLLGSAILVRPSLLPATLVVTLFLLVVPKPVSHRIRMLLLMMAGLLFVCAPWVARNYAVFGEFVPVSTNGGAIFFRANNSLATGGYTAIGDRPLREYMYDELLWNRTGYAWGVEWIGSHPMEFLRLAVAKLGMLLANGAVPIEWTLKGTRGESGLPYVVLYGIGHVWWILLWSLAGAALCRHRLDLATNLAAALLFSLVLVIPIVHAVFESQPRHHLPMVGIVIVLSALAFLPKTTRLRDPWAEAAGRLPALQPVRPLGGS